MIPLFFSAEGRLNRSRFWLGALGSSVLLTTLVTAVVAALWQVMPGEVTAAGEFHVSGATALPYVVALLGYLVLQVWIAVCLGVKRYHDMDNPGTRMLVILIPLVGSLIYFFQAGFGRGTTGGNKYGPDLLAPALG